MNQNIKKHVLQTSLISQFVWKSHPYFSPAAPLATLPNFFFSRTNTIYVEHGREFLGPMQKQKVNKFGLRWKHLCNCQSVRCYSTLLCTSTSAAVRVCALLHFKAYSGIQLCTSSSIQPFRLHCPTFEEWLLILHYFREFFLKIKIFGLTLTKTKR